MKIKYVVMDVDGTIFDSEAYCEKVFADLLYENHNIPREDSIEYHKNITGSPVGAEIKNVLLMFGRKTDSVEWLVGEFFERVQRQTSPLFPGVKRMLFALAKRRNLAFFASSGNRSDILDRCFKEVGIFDLFVMILGSEVIPKSAVHIEIFARAAKVSRAEFTPRAIYIGDGPTDMKIAKECGIFAVGVATTVSAEKLRESGADVVINELNISELREILV